VCFVWCVFCVKYVCLRAYVALCLYALHSGCKQMEERSQPSTLRCMLLFLCVVCVCVCVCVFVCERVKGAMLMCLYSERT
jgi:hypothetical protein